MRIAQVSPLVERVPPQGYGGVELIVAQLTDELVNRGHDVTLFASGDSQTKAKLISVVPRAFRLDPTVEDPGAYNLLQLTKVLEEAHNFDIIHFHMGFGSLPFINMLNTPTVDTLHYVFKKDRCKLYTKYRNHNYISISNAQQKNQPELNYVRTVYNSIETDIFPFQAQPAPEPYLAFIARFIPEKGAHHAIAIAKQTGWRLKIAGKADKEDLEYFETEIASHIDGQQIQYLGEVNHDQKIELLANATATLFPITWNEPFGLVMIESMCTGTPVIAMNKGSVPEVILHGKTGFVCNNIEEMIAALPSVSKLDRKACHDYVVNTFSIAKMVDGYEAAYQQVLN